jgi:hypothetical protein
MGKEKNHAKGDKINSKYKPQSNNHITRLIQDDDNKA